MGYGLHKIFNPQSAAHAGPIPQVTSGSALKRTDLVRRLLNNPLVADYLHRSELAGPGNNTRAIILSVMSFDHPVLNALVDEAIANVDRKGPIGIMDDAQKMLDDFKKDLQMEEVGQTDVKSFYRRNTFGEFDPQQFFLTKSFGPAKSSLESYDMIADKPDSKKWIAKATARIKTAIVQGYTLLRAAEIASSR